MVLDDPSTTEGRRALIQRKGLLRRVYLDWYRRLLAGVPDGPGRILELGSGAGFLSELCPGVIRTEVLAIRGVDLRCDARRLPVRSASLRAIVMTDVLHHIPDVAAFLHEAVRTLAPGGVVAMVEPWAAPFARFVWSNFHHEPFLPNAPDWAFPSNGPLSSANGALPWMVFVRDRDRFALEFPQLRIERLEPMMPFAYLLSGGLRPWSLAPGAFYPAIRAADRWLSSQGLFAHILLRRCAE